MTSTSIEKARTFLAEATLPEAPRGPVLEEVAAFDFNKARDQALVVGSEIVSFVKGVTDERRQDIVNSTLLAQLVAKKRVPDATKVIDWYNAYFDALSNIGWVIQERQLNDYIAESTDLEAHEAILSVATTLLGPGTAALQVVTAALNALQSMRTNSSWITLFNRESQTASTAHFQVTLAEQAADGQLLVTLMAFGLFARSTLTQVLFFKFQTSEVELKHSSGKVTIDDAVLAAIRPAITNKLAGFAAEFIKGLPDL